MKKLSETKKDIAELCKGSTTDSDSVCLGSNPSSAAIKETSFVYQGKRGFCCIAVVNMVSLMW